MNPVIRQTFLNDFLSKFDSAFGKNVSGDIHYVDSAHSLGFSSPGGVFNIYIGDNSLISGGAYIDSVKYVFSKYKSCLYADFRTTMSSGDYTTYSVAAARADNGSYSVFYSTQRNDETANSTLYYAAPSLDSLPSAVVPSAGNSGYPYIISPCSDLSGRNLQDLFLIGFMPKFSPDDPPVIASDKRVFIIPPYPNRDSDTAAFAIEIDPADYE